MRRSSDWMMRRIYTAGQDVGGIDLGSHALLWSTRLPEITGTYQADDVRRFDLLLSRARRLSDGFGAR